VLLAALASFAPVPASLPECAAAGSHHAALVVEHGDGSVVSRCVAFAMDSISGEQLLNLSGVSWSSRTFGGFGDAVCALDGEPARYVDCPGKDNYWAVFATHSGGSWQLANVGISSLVLHDGDAEGVRFVPASGVPAAPVSASGVCAAAATPAPRRSAGSGIVSAPPTAAPATPTVAAEATTAATESPAPVAVAAVATGRAAVAAGPPYQAPTQPPPAGLDLGLLLAAVVGGGLAGLAILRLVAGRRPGP
jgi:hypothetical protein